MTERLTRRGFLRLAGVGAGAAVLAACAPAAPAKPTEAPQQQPTAAPQPVEATAAPTQAAQAGEKVKLTMLTTGTPDDLVENLKPFVEQHPDYDVKVIGVSWDEFDDKVNLMIAGGDSPAIWAPLANRDVGYHVKRGFVPPLDPFIEKDNYKFDDFYTFNPDGCTIRGKKYGVQSSVFPTPLAYNTRLFEEAGVPAPPSDWNDKSWTWDDFVARAQKLTKPAEDPMSTVWGWDSGWDRRYACLYFGIDMWKPEDYDSLSAKTSLVTSKEFRWTLQMQQDFIWKHKVEPSPEQSAAFSAVVPQGSFFSGKAAMTNGVTWVVAGLKDVEFKWRLAPYPVNAYGGYRGILYLNYWSMLKVPNQDAAWELLKYCVSKEAQEQSVAMVAAGRGNGVTQGGIPCRKDVAPKQLDAMAAAVNCDRKELDQFLQAIPCNHIFNSIATPAWAEVWDIACQPMFDQILMNKITVDEATAKMDEKINEILAKEQW